MLTNRERVVRLTTLAILIAIITLMTFVPNLGYLQIGTLSITTLHVPVIIGSAFLGPLGGFVLGITWGFTSWLKVMTTVVNPIEFALFSNPLISILPRILVGLMVAYGSPLISKWVHKTSLKYAILAFVGTLSNTILVLGAIGLFSAGTLFPQSQTLSIILITILSTNGLTEIILAMILVPAIMARLPRK